MSNSSPPVLPRGVRVSSASAGSLLLAVLAIGLLPACGGSEVDATASHGRHYVGTYDYQAGVAEDVYLPDGHGIDRGPLVLVGHSAGAHLAALAALVPDKVPAGWATRLLRSTA
jgi:pimeloyl-ACP methyl ester carboxylesterase